ncbi:sensor histidine kinase [Dyadobacter sp. BHUBP1]|uniref:sensor histidine kinase n=1 Tax=Dyadobacter sp. BHUBP1 TaxID=3424178 RepID=UPI003D3422A1
MEEKNSKLEILLKEKEWLIREVHHRVKNNLQMIVSLIDSQASYLNNGALDAVLDSKHRIEAMSLIHQKLYLSEDVTTVNMRWYINELITYLKDCIGSNQSITFTSDLEEIYLDVSNAVPIGLILNEAITNSIKHAFPDNEPGCIRVAFGGEEENVNLVVSDNDIGLSPDFDTRRAGSLGMNLMYGLATEVNGDLTIDGANGTTVSISFVLPKVLQPFSSSVVAGND